MAQWPGFTKTRIRSLGLTQTGKIWRWCDISDTTCDPATVGPHYATKMEALADLERYSRDIWDNDSNPPVTVHCALENIIYCTPDGMKTIKF